MVWFGLVWFDHVFMNCSASDLFAIEVPRNRIGCPMPNNRSKQIQETHTACNSAGVKKYRVPKYKIERLSVYVKWFGMHQCFLSRSRFTPCMSKGTSLFWGTANVLTPAYIYAASLNNTKKKKKKKKHTWLHRQQVIVCDQL